MWTDPIVEEVRRARNEYARRFNYDLDSIFEDVRRRQAQGGYRFVRRPPRPVEPVQIPPASAKP